MPRGKRDESKIYLGATRLAKLAELWGTFATPEEIRVELLKLPGLPQIPMDRLSRCAKDMGVKRPDGYRSFAAKISRKDYHGEKA